eukprot:gene6821-7184_t
MRVAGRARSRRLRCTLLEAPIGGCPAQCGTALLASYRSDLRKMRRRAVREGVAARAPDLPPRLSSLDPAAIDTACLSDVRPPDFDGGAEATRQLLLAQPLPQWLTALAADLRQRRYLSNDAQLQASVLRLDGRAAPPPAREPACFGEPVCAVAFAAAAQLDWANVADAEADAAGFPQKKRGGGGCRTAGRAAGGRVD